MELEKVAPGQLQTGEITERQAREILAAPEEKREEILDQINEAGEIPSAREIRRAVQPKPVAPRDPRSNREHAREAFRKGALECW